MPRVPPPDYAEFLSALNHGRVNQAITERFGVVIEEITSRASEHGTDWKGDITVKIKLTANKYGKVSAKVSSTENVDAIPLPGGDMFYDPDSGALLEQEPRQVKIPGFEDEGRRRVKSADAPERK